MLLPEDLTADAFLSPAYTLDFFRTFHVVKYMPYMTALKEHILLFYYDQNSHQKYDYGLHALGLRSQGDLFLHVVYEHMEDDTGQDGTVAREIYPGYDVAHEHGAHKKVDDKQRVHHEPRLVGALDE